VLFRTEISNYQPNVQLNKYFSCCWTAEFFFASAPFRIAVERVLSRRHHCFLFCISVVVACPPASMSLVAESRTARRLPLPPSQAIN
jgi:hypothetical protein